MRRHYLTHGLLTSFQLREHYRGDIMISTKALIPSIDFNPNKPKHINDVIESCNENGVDRLLAFDLSNNDTEHEVTLGRIKSFADKSEAMIIGAGNIDRMEDVKKLLYAGCKKVALNLAKPSNIELMEEVSLKFGKDKMAVCIKTLAEYQENKTQIEKYISLIICLNNNLEQIETQTSLEIILNSQLMMTKPKALVSNIAWNEFKLNGEGMMPVIVQDYRTNEVLMMAYMNEAAFNETLATGKMTYYSRSRNELWVKGLTSGHVQYLKALMLDCDRDTILAKVSQIGVACHTGSESCFFNELVKKEYRESNPLKVFQAVFDVILKRKKNPKEGSYTNYLFDKGLDKILKKVGEECTEIVIAAKNPDQEEIKYEIADFLYHVMVLMVEKEVTWEDITKELAHRS